MRPTTTSVSGAASARAPRRSRPALLAAVALAAAAALVALPTVGAHGAHADEPAFGINVWGVKDLQAKGVTPAYGLVWANHWDGDNGFYGVKNALRLARDKGVTPVVQWYYWGDSISQNCVKYGCHGKSRSEWDRDAARLASAIKDVMGSRLAIVVIETEFNKNGVQWYEAMDGYLAKQSWTFRNRGIQTVIGFGNWGSDHWGRFDRAAGSATYVGIQELSSAARDSTSTMLESAEKVYAGGKRLHEKFGKRVLVTDFGVSTWQGKEWVQEREIRDVVWQKEKFARAGITGFIYRSAQDRPSQSWGYHGHAEKYWGLKRSDGSWKPAFSQYLSGIKGAPSAWEAYKG